jgi:uncharacterized protein with HEPN domain
MFDVELVLGILDQVLVAARRIERRFEPIGKPEDFLTSDEGLDRLDGISMMVIAIGESLKQVDRLTDGTLLRTHAEVDWQGAKGARDILSHHYFDLDAEVLFAICRDHIPRLIEAVEKLKAGLSSASPQ